MDGYRTRQPEPSLLSEVLTLQQQSFENCFRNCFCCAKNGQNQNYLGNGKSCYPKISGPDHTEANLSLPVAYRFIRVYKKRRENRKKPPKLTPKFSEDSSKFSVVALVELELESDSNLLARNCSEIREELISESEILVPTKKRVFRSGKFEFR